MNPLASQAFRVIQDGTLRATSLLIPASGRSEWRRDFVSDPDIAGRVVRIGNQTARIAGVMPRGAWRLPGQPDAWLLEPDRRLATDTSPAPFGYLIARLSPLGQACMKGAVVQIARCGTPKTTSSTSTASPLPAVSGILGESLNSGLSSRSWRCLRSQR